MEGGLTGHKSRQPSPGDFREGLCPGKEGVLLIYEPLCSLVNKNKTAGVITNSLLTGSIIYEKRGEVLQARGFFGIPTRPELGWCDEDSAWGAPTASTARAWCTFPWVQVEKGWGQMWRAVESCPLLLCDSHQYKFVWWEEHIPLYRCMFTVCICRFLHITLHAYKQGIYWFSQHFQR